MTTLSWLIYFAGVTAGFQTVFILSAIIAALATIISLIISIADGAEYIPEPVRNNVWK